MQILQRKRADTADISVIFFSVYADFMAVSCKVAKDSVASFRLAGYTNQVENMEEELFFSILDSVQTGEMKLVLLVSDEEISPMDMPRLLGAQK